MSEPFIGQIVMFAGNFAPPGWALCDGQLLPISQNTALFSILGTTYGGDGRTTFGLPELRGRFAMHPGNGPGLPPYQLGQKGGAPSTTQVPAHSHGFTVPADSSDGDMDKPIGNFPAPSPQAYSSTADAGMGPGTTAVTGQSGGVSVQNPYQAINFIIALVGIFPSQN